MRIGDSAHPTGGARRPAVARQRQWARLAPSTGAKVRYKASSRLPTPMLLAMLLLCRRAANDGLQNDIKEERQHHQDGPTCQLPSDRHIPRLSARTDAEHTALSATRTRLLRAHPPPRHLKTLATHPLSHRPATSIKKRDNISPQRVLRS